MPPQQTVFEAAPIPSIQVNPRHQTLNRHTVPDSIGPKRWVGGVLSRRDFRELSGARAPVLCPGGTCENSPVFQVSTPGLIHPIRRVPKGRLRGHDTGELGQGEKRNLSSENPEKSDCASDSKD